jgi:hypothetical protein
MQFKSWLMLREVQSQDTLFMQTQKSGLGPKPSTNAGVARPSDGWLRGRGRSAGTTLWMKKKMKKESVFHEDHDTDSYERIAKEFCYLLDTRPSSIGQYSDRSKMDQEALKLLHKYFEDGNVDWHRLEEASKNYLVMLYKNYSQEYIKTQEAKLDAMLAYIPRYLKSNI